MLAGLPLLRSPLEPWQPWFRVAGLDWPEPCAGPRLLDLGMTLEAAANGRGVALARPSLARAWLPRGGWWCCSRCVRRRPTITTCAATRPRRPASVSPPGWRRSAGRWSRSRNSFRRRTTETAEFPSADADNYSACGGTSRSTIQPPRRSGLHERHHRYRRPAPPGAARCRGCSTTTPTPVPGAKAPTAPTRTTSPRSSCASGRAEHREPLAAHPHARPGDGHAGGHRAHRAGRHAACRRRDPRRPRRRRVRRALHPVDHEHLFPGGHRHGSRPAVLVPALRDARPRFHRTPDRPCQGRRLRAGADPRPADHRPAPGT